MLKKINILIIAAVQFTAWGMKQEASEITDLMLTTKIRSEAKWPSTVEGRNPLFSPDGEWLLVDNNNLMNFYDTKTWHAQKSLKIPNHFRYSFIKAFSPDSKWLAVSSKKYIQIWEINTREIKCLQGKNDIICSLGFSPNGKLLAVGDRLGDVWGWDMTTSTEFKIHTCYYAESHGNHLIGNLTFSPDSKYLITGSNNADIATYEISYENKNNKSEIIITSKDLHSNIYNTGFRCASLDISKNGKYLATAIYKKTYNESEPSPGKVKIFNFPNLINNQNKNHNQPNPIYTLKRDDKVTFAKFTPNNRFLIVTTIGDIQEDEGKIEIINVRNWDTLGIINKDNTDSLTVSPDNQFFTYLTYDIISKDQVVNIISLRPLLYSNNLTPKEEFEAGLEGKAATYKAQLKSTSYKIFKKIRNSPWQKLKKWWNNFTN